MKYQWIKKSTYLLILKYKIDNNKKHPSTIFPQKNWKNEITELCPVSKHIKEFDLSFDKKMSALADPSARGQNKIHRHAYTSFP